MYGLDCPCSVFPCDDHGHVSWMCGMAAAKVRTARQMQSAMLVLPVSTSFVSVQVRPPLKEGVVQVQSR